MSLDDLKIKGRTKSLWWLKDKFRKYKAPVVATVLAGALGLYGLVSSYRAAVYKNGLFENYNSVKVMIEEKRYDAALDLLTILKEELKQADDARLVGLSKNVDRLENRVCDGKIGFEEDFEKLKNFFEEYQKNSARAIEGFDSLESRFENYAKSYQEDNQEFQCLKKEFEEFKKRICESQIRLDRLETDLIETRQKRESRLDLGQTFYSDDFSKDKGWLLGIIDSSLGKDACSYNISNGTLTLTAGWSSCPLALVDKSVKNAIIEVDAQLVSSSYKSELVCAGICVRVPEGDLRNMRDMCGFNIRSGVGEKNTLFSRNGSKSMGKSTFAPNIEIGKWYHLKMDVYDTHVQCYIDDNLIFDEVLPEGSIPEKGRVGFYCNGSEISRYDNFKLILRN